MTKSHQIRLRGPWECQRQGVGEVAARVALPCSWNTALGDYTGLVTWCRRFHAPTGINAGDRVLVVLSGLTGITTVRVNGHCLLPVIRPSGEIEYDLTSRLLPANMLEIEQGGPDPEDSNTPGGLWTPVILEIVS